jgi:hypothetical protein
MQDKDPPLTIEPKKIDSTFLANAFLQTRNLPPRDKIRPGKHFQAIKRMFGDESAVSNYVRQNVGPTMMGQSLSVGSYDVTPYHMQEQPLTCNLAVFRMILESVTGENVSENEIYNAAKEAGLLKESKTGKEGDLIRIIHVDPPHQEDLLRIFKTEAFHQKFPEIEVGIVPIVGADFEDFQQAAQEIRAKLGKGSQLFVAVSLESEVVTGQFHEVILLSAGEGFVVMHDPSNAQGIGGPYKKIPIDKFIERYGKSNMWGDLIAVRKK